MAILKKGAKGIAVRELQGLLNSRFHRVRLKVDGDFGEGTEAAVKDFQKLVGLTADGIAGPRTQAALHQAAAEHLNGFDPISLIDLVAFFNSLEQVGKHLLKPLGNMNVRPPASKEPPPQISPKAKKSDWRAFTRASFPGYEGQSYIVRSDTYSKFEGGAIQLLPRKVVVGKGEDMPAGLKNECAQFVQYFGIPVTGTWRRGPRVCDFGPGTLPIGTVVATLRDGGYHSDYSGRSHVGIYLSHEDYSQYLTTSDTGSGVVLMDQYNGARIARRKKRYSVDADAEGKKSKRAWTDSEGNKREKRVNWVQDGEEYYVLLTTKE